MRIDFHSQVPGDLDVRWIHGSPSARHNRDPEIQVHHYDQHTMILRQNMAVHYEAPFLYLLFGNERALLVDTGATPQPDPNQLPAGGAAPGAGRGRPAGAAPGHPGGRRHPWRAPLRAVRALPRCARPALRLTMTLRRDRRLRSTAVSWASPGERREEAHDHHRARRASGNPAARDDLEDGLAGCGGGRHTRT